MFPILFSIGPLHIYSLSVFVVLSWCVFSFILWKLLRAQAIPEEKIFDLTFYTTLITLVAARVGFIFIHPELFADSFLKMLALWVVPGLSFYVGLIAGTLTLLFLARKYDIRLGLSVDALGLSLPIPVALAAFGSLLGGSQAGLVTKLPWGVRFVGFDGSRHPLGAYEAIASIIIFVVLLVLSRLAARRDWPLGFVGIWFFMLFSVVMFIVEFFAEDRVYWYNVSANQWLILAIFTQTVGAFYVRGGGRQKLRSMGGNLYARIFKRSS